MASSWSKMTSIVDTVNDHSTHTYSLTSPTHTSLKAQGVEGHLGIRTGHGTKMGHGSPNLQQLEGHVSLIVDPAEGHVLVEREYKEVGLH